MFGAAFARAATDMGKRCIVFERKPHLAGAAHDRLVGTTYVASYGAHIFHTSSEEVWQFVQRFSQWEPYRHTVKASAKGLLYSLPVNLGTMHCLMGSEVRNPKEAEKWLASQVVPCAEPRNLEEWALSRVGRTIYEHFIYGYTKKQYHCEPRELPASILARLPIRLTWDDSYFTAKYCAMPLEGYTSFVRRMLEGVEVHLGTPLPDGWKQIAKRCVHTGRLDELLGYRLGHVPYKSMRFTEQVHHGDYQGTSVVNHCDESVPYLRTVEYKHFKRCIEKHQTTVGDQPTIVTYDWPCKDGEPFYPINSDDNVRRHRLYADAVWPLGFVPGGRLGEYRYYDMDQAIASALQKARKLCT